MTAPQPVQVQQQHRAQMRNPPAQHNVQSYLKLSTPVVLNHELLASYGVSINNNNNNNNSSNGQQPIIVNESKVPSSSAYQKSQMATSQANSGAKVLVAAAHFQIQQKAAEAGGSLVGAGQLIPIQLQSLSHSGQQQVMQPGAYLSSATPVAASEQRCVIASSFLFFLII